MKNSLLILSFSASILLAGCGPSTRLVSSWNPKENVAKSYDKLAVAVLFPSISNRMITEEALTESLKSHNIKAVQTFDTFPLAGKAKEILSIAKKPEELKESVKQKVIENKIDALMIVTLFDKKTEQRYVEGSGFTLGGTGFYGNGYYGNTYYGNLSPNYPGGSYYDYYTYSAYTISKPGYYVEDVIYYAECNLYDIASEKLIWTGQTKTVNLSSIEKEAAKFATIIANALIDKNILIP